MKGHQGNLSDTMLMSIFDSHLLFGAFVPLPPSSLRHLKSFGIMLTHPPSWRIPPEVPESRHETLSFPKYMSAPAFPLPLVLNGENVGR